MYIILKTSWAMIKRKKVQSILVSIIITLIAMLLYLGLSMMNLSSPAKGMFERANATENLLMLDKRTDNVELSKKWWNSQEAVEGTVEYKGLMVNGEYSIGDKTEAELIMVTEFIEDSDYDLMYQTEDKLAIAPKGNEMLINYNFASGRDLSLGDVIKINNEGKTYEFIISGFLVDPHYSNPFISVNRCFVEKGFFEKEGLDNGHVILGIKYKNWEAIDDIALYEEYKKDMKVQPIYVDFASINASYNIISGVIASILLLVSLFIFAIVIFVIRASVRNIILQQYKQIGVKKVLGYTSKQIRYSFLWMYGAIGIISSITGALLGVPIRRSINTGISYDLQVGVKSKLDIYIVVTVILVVLLLSLFTFLATKETINIKPVQAIKYGMPERKVTSNTFDITKSKVISLSFLLSIKQILVNQKKAIITTLTITILIYVAFLINATGYSLANEEHFIKNLFGYQVGDYSFVNSSNDSINEVFTSVKDKEADSNVVFSEMKMGESTLNIDGSKSITLLAMHLYGDYPENGLNLTQGRKPVNNREIVISSDMTRETGKTVGDYIIITTDAGDEHYIVSGVFNTVVNMGLMYLICNENAPENIAQSNGVYWVYSSEEHVIIEEKEVMLKALLGEQVSVTRFDSNIKNVLSTIEVFPIVIKSLLMIFLLVCGVIILNFTMIDINNSTKVFGVMKTIGYSNLSITKILVIRSVLLTSIGIIVGFGLNVLTANFIMNGIFSITPFSSIEMPVLFDGLGSLILVMLFLTMSIVATLIPAKRVSVISPKMLISE